MDLRLLSQGPALRILFFGHLVPTVLALQGEILPSSYLFYNAFFFIGILWCLHSPESEEPILITTFMDLLFILMDAITIGVHNRVFTWGTFFVIINLLLRPISSLILLRFYNERSGRYNTLGIPGFANYGAGTPATNPTSTSGRGGYQDIESRPYQTVPSSLVDTGSPVKSGPS